MVSKKKQKFKLNRLQKTITTSHISNKLRALDYNNNAGKYFRNGDVNKSINEYKKAIKLDPYNPIYHANLGEVYFQLKDYQKSMVNYQNARKHAPNELKYLSAIGDIYFELKEYHTAIDIYNNLLKKNFEQSINYNKIGDAYFKLKYYPKATDNYKKAIKLNDDIKYHKNLAYCYILQEKYQETINIYNKISNKDKTIYELLAYSYNKLGEYSEAESIILDKLKRDNLSTLILLSDTYFKQQKYHLAILEVYKIKDLENNDKVFNRYIDVKLVKYLILYLNKLYPQENNLEINEIEKQIKRILLDINLNIKKELNININNSFLYSSFESDLFKEEFWNHLQVATITNILLSLGENIDVQNKDFLFKVYNRIAKLIDQEEFDKILDFIKLIYLEIKNVNLSLNINLNQIKKIINNNNNSIKTIKLKLFLLENLKNEIEEKITNKNYQAIINISNIYITITKGLQEEISELTTQMEREKAEIELKAKDDIIADMAHSIKNLISNVSTPLYEIENEDFDKKYLIKNAIRGTELISNIVNALNLSYKGSIEDFYYDIFSNSKKISLNEIITSAMVYAINSMFDGSNFGKFQEKYINSKEFYTLKSEFGKLSNSKKINQLKEYLEKNFFKFNLNISENNLKIGDEKGSSLKFLMLFQEIFLNAVKYSAFVDKKDRFFDINIQIDDKIIIEVKNKYNPYSSVKTTGIGHILIKNFTKLINGNIKVDNNDSIYRVYIEFDNLWRKNDK